MSQVTKPPSTLQDWLQQAAHWLPRSASPRLDMELLLCHCFNKPRSWLLAWPETVVPMPMVECLRGLLTRRQAGEPIAYLTGVREFWSLPLQIVPGVLVPRPETETLVAHALNLIPAQKNAVVLDLGTGSGAIAVALARERSHWQVIALDLDITAIYLAHANARRFQCTNLHCLRADWGNCLTSCADLIVSNPPYIAEHDPCLSTDGVCQEPRQALVSAEQGLADIRCIITQSMHLLCHDGWLILEHGYNQASQVRRIMADNGFSQLATLQDWQGKDRISSGQWLDYKK